jgi:hypoxanthine phosphoribosyltransferase
MPPATPPTHISPLFTAEEIAARVETIAAEVAAAFPHEFLMVSVLKGAFVFSADLIRALHDLGVHPEVTFITLSSYGGATESSGLVRMQGEFAANVAGRRVLIVDDILDTGQTLAYAKRMLAERGAEEVRLCVLVDKPVRREVQLEPDFVGFTIGDHFIVGYGIDYAEAFRDLPYLAKLDQPTPR